jgi:hypothetical protein
MGTYSRFTGRIEIDPPLPWGLIKDSPSYPGSNFRSDVRLVIEQNEIDTEEGVTIRRRAVAIEPATEDSTKGYYTTQHVQAIVDLAGLRTFRGYIEAISEEGDRWRVKVAGGIAIEVVPTITWPDEDQP